MGMPKRMYRASLDSPIAETMINVVVWKVEVSTAGRAFLVYWNLVANVDARRLHAARMVGYLIRALSSGNRTDAFAATGRSYRGCVRAGHPQKPQTKKAHLAVSLSRQTMVPAPGIEPGTY